MKQLKKDLSTVKKQKEQEVAVSRYRTCTFKTANVCVCVCVCVCACMRACVHVCVRVCV